MQTITRSSLAAVLATVSGATFATIETRTQVRLKKTWQGGAVEKESRVNVTLNANYEKSVNRQLGREGKDTDFEAMPRQWGNRVPHTPLVTHNGKFYLECKVEKSFNSTYYMDGQEIDKAMVEPHFYASSSRQGTDKEIIVRDYSLDSIVRINLNGNSYRVVETVPVGWEAIEA